MEYRIDDQQLNAAAFIDFANKVWPGKYDEDRTAAALSKTLNITAYDGETLVGCLRILTDGYFFGTITEMLVLPEYQRQGIGSRLLQLARENTPTMLYFGAQPVANCQGFVVPFLEFASCNITLFSLSFTVWLPFSAK